MQAVVEEGGCSCQVLVTLAQREISERSIQALRFANIATLRHLLYGRESKSQDTSIAGSACVKEHPAQHHQPSLYITRAAFA